MEEDDALESKYTVLECFCVMIVDIEGFAERLNLMSEHCQKYTSSLPYSYRLHGQTSEISLVL